MINYLLAGLLGVTFFFLGQANETRKDLKAAGNDFMISKFFKGEFISMLMHIVAVLILAVTVNEWGPKSGIAKNFITCIFVLGGIIGPWLISLVASASKKYARGVIDIKTNVAEKIIGKTDSVKDTIKAAKDEGITVKPTE